MRNPSLSLCCTITFALSLSGCVTEQDRREEAQAVQAAYDAKCRSDMLALRQTIPNRWERRIAQNDVAARCYPDQASLLGVANAYVGLAQKHIRDGKWSEEEAWFNYVSYVTDLEQRQRAEKQRLEEARLEALGQALLGLGIGGGPIRMPPPQPVVQPSRRAPPISCTSNQVGSSTYTNCY